MGLSNEDRAEIKRALRDAQAESETHVAQLKETSRPVDLDDPIGRLTRVDAMQSQQMARAALIREEDRLEKIVQAIRRSDDSAFGDCVYCGKPIPLDRLRVFPETTACVACAR